MKKNQLSVRLNGEQVGILEQTPTGKMAFTYDSSATQVISIGMPIREEPYSDIKTEAYFGGLLPESETVKKIIGIKYGISHNNNFSLLKAIGYDCAGAISCDRIDHPYATQNTFPLQGKIITDDELCKHIIELPQKPLFMDDMNGLRLSLAGAQDKAAVCLINNQVALSENGCPTTHILKPSSSHFEGLAENEYFCLRIAKRIGLPVPDIQLRKAKNITYLLIERYDRRVTDNHVRRIHQEDFCQALGILTPKKYQNEGGPGFKECFDLLKNTAQPAIDRNLLASALVFNYLICNMDAHGKNFSLLHHTQANIRLAPFYDMICTRVYDCVFRSKRTANPVCKRTLIPVTPEHLFRCIRTPSSAHVGIIC
jgi:serine/threonine-protein kinase HipA